ncbi:MAG: DoxX family protein [Mycobacteriaceae bacterium]
MTDTPDRRDELDESQAETRAMPAQSARSDTDGLDIPTYAAPDRAEPVYVAPTYTASNNPESTEMDPGGSRVADVELSAPVRRGTSDLGLLLLRVGLGVVLVAHGLQNAFGLFNGPGISSYRDLLQTAGYQHPQLLAYVGSLTELVAGVLLVLGLLTPLAAAGALGVSINVWLVADLASPGFHFFVADKGQEYEMVLVLLAAVVALVGPGRYSLDGRRGWATRPLVSSWLALVVGIAAGLLVWFLLNGARPFA